MPSRALKSSVVSPCRIFVPREQADRSGFAQAVHGVLGRRKSTVRKPCALSVKHANDFENRPVHSPLTNSKRGHFMSGNAILENVRRYRTIASLCRQTAAFRRAQKWTLLAQAYEWERLAMTELETWFPARESEPRSEMAAAA